jgi:hypothetical protein
MLIPGDTFPYKPITDGNQKVIEASCGGSPVTDPELFRNFLQTSGLPMLGSVTRRAFFNDVAWRTVSGFGYEDKASLRSVNRGILFYAGVAAEIGHLAEVAYHPEIAADVRDADSRNQGIEALQVLSSETEGFCELMARVRIGMQTALDDQLYAFSLMGAGIAHIVNTRSAERVLAETQEAVLAGYEQEFANGQAGDWSAGFDEFGL